MDSGVWDVVSKLRSERNVYACFFETIIMYYYYYVIIMYIMYVLFTSSCIFKLKKSQNLARFTQSLLQCVALSKLGVTERGPKM